ncbi:MAG TPA: hypothetical protein ENG14_03435 [Thermodesulforhabdus norvegica]|uniref:Uroporphyrinogen decarboxylase (URO-D) domain-containing protein n=1 Tax=Thermodesulforhabdus norvegica TaxID=39841 RepID=A0A7C1AW19_9BACT|nr:hypothetical protein [Thermodesulforhabdus norvegica]
MESMTSRERILAALSHKEPDRVPIDLGGTTASTIVVDAYENIKKHLGLKHENKLRAFRAQTVIPDDTVLDLLGVDTRPLLLNDFPNTNSDKAQKNSFVDPWGTTWEKSPDGHYINVNGPFQNSDPNIELLESYKWPNPDDPKIYLGLKERADHLRKNTDCAIILNLPLGFVHQCQFMRGFSEWLTDLIAFPEFAQRLIDITSSIWIRVAQNALDIVGAAIDIIEWGDDVAMQQGPLFNPDMYRKIIKPVHRKMMEALRSKSDARILYHSCGSVELFIEDFIEMGIDAINPVQVTAKNMNPSDLKRKYGERVAFWGGIDTQHILPSGTTSEVRAEVRRICRILGRNGGYILAAVHNIQRDVLPENILAMFDEAKLA